MESQTASDAQLWYDGSSQWLWTWAVEYFNTYNISYVVSHSWGWATDQQCTIEQCTSGNSADYVERVNNEYLKLVARGVTMTVASGDSGAPGRSAASCDPGNRTVVPIFPGSSPWVISVGATYVVSNNTPSNVSYTTPLCKKDDCATGLTEATINTADVGWTAGGGFGEYTTEGVVPWQAAAVQSYLNKSLPLPTYFNRNGRGYPDLAVVGHNCPVWENGVLSDVDGTSCSSPTFASIIAILNSHQLARGKPRLGLATPVLHGMYYDDPSIYQDITVGNNWCTEGGCCPTRPDGGSEYGYQAAVGWDPVAGLGTPNVGKMLAWLDNNI
jgi:tripeptidyl-peptidase-1